MDDRKKILVDLFYYGANSISAVEKTLVLSLLKTMMHQDVRCQWVLIIPIKYKEELASFFSKEQDKLKFIISQKVVKSPSWLSFKFLRQYIPIPKIIYSNFMWYIEEVKFYCASIFKKKYDLVFCPFAAPRYKCAKAPIISVLNETAFLKSAYLYDYDNYLERFFEYNKKCKYASMLITASKYTKEFLVNSKLIDIYKITTITPAPISKSQDRESILNLEHLGLNANNYIIYPANFSKLSNHEMLLVAIQMAIKNGLNPLIKFVFFGDRDKKTNMKAIIQKFGLSDRVIMIDDAKEYDVIALIKSAMFMIYPAFHEELGIYLIEAMINGVAITCSSSDSLNEFVGESALQFDCREPFSIAKCILSMSQNAELREKLIKKGLVQASRYQHVEQEASAYMNLFRKVMQLKQEHGNEIINCDTLI